jgi:heat shock protein beta
MVRVSTVLKAVCMTMLVVAIIGEETETDKGAPVAFGAEVGKMLDILINSLYTNRNIFLREIISNASDALDKIRFLYLTNPKEPKNDAGEEPNMDIRITVDREGRKFMMRDGGIGMTKADMEGSLGSLGSSGTKKFLESMKDGTDSNFIGQFGVGFYSVFLVAERVRVASKHDDSDKQWVWESTGDGTYFLGGQAWQHPRPWHRAHARAQEGRR